MTISRFEVARGLLKRATRNSSPSRQNITNREYGVIKAAAGSTKTLVKAFESLHPASGMPYFTYFAPGGYDRFIADSSK